MHELCCICQYDLSNNTQLYTLPECGHTFHLECVITWWRSPRDRYSEFGTCPMCRCASDKKFNWYQAKHRASFLRKISRKKFAHPELKKAVLKLRLAEEKSKKKFEEYKNYRNRPEVKKILKKYNKLRIDVWVSKTNIRRKRDMVCTFDPIAAMGDYIPI